MEDKEPERQKLPEFIFIDEEIESEQIGGGFEGTQTEFYTSFQQLERAKYPPLLRVLTLFLGAIFLGLIYLMFVGTLILGVLSLLTLRFIPQLNQGVSNFWGYTKKVTVFCLGFTTATFSPAFGLGIIVLYFMMLGEKLDKGFMARILRSHSPI